MKKINFSKTNWKIYKFSDIAENIVEKITPKESDVKYYVGLENLDSDSIHINQFESPQTLKGDKLVGYKGDVILGKRNAYLKRAAILDRKVIASAHSFILRAKKEVILPELFIFFLNSEAFWDTAIRISVGSLSPTINWKTLAKQKFAIPPLNEQKKLTGLLLSGDKLLQRYSVLKNKLNTLYESNVQDLNKGANSSKLTSCKLGEVLNINPENISSKTDGKTEIYYIDISSIGYKEILTNEIKKFLFKDAPSRAKRIVEEGDVIISLVRPYQQKIVIAKNIENNTLSSTGTAILRTKNRLLLSLAYHQLFSKNFIYFCERIMTGTNYPAITADDLAKFKIFFYEDPEKNKILTKALFDIESEVLVLSKQINSIKKIISSLKNEIFE